MEKRYQVFVSSTYEDLKQERNGVMRALLELGHFPAGMELFPAANESQWTLIKKYINDCDYYVVVVGGRYGSLGPDSLSFTEMEYRYALSINKPVLAFLHADPTSLPFSRCETDETGRNRLQAFRDLLKERVCQFWTSSDELSVRVTVSLVRLISDHAAVGWIRADQMMDNASTQILQLRNKLDSVEAELRSVRTEAPNDVAGFAQGDDKATINYRYEVRNYDRETGSDWKTVKGTIETTWDSLFAELAPRMMTECSENKFQEYMDHFVSMRAANVPDTMPRTRVSAEKADTQMVKIQLRALGLIFKSRVLSEDWDSTAFWQLTPYGDSRMATLLAVTRRSKT